jgi:hypothetical protein
LFDLVACNILNETRTSKYHKSYHITGIAVGNGFTDPITILDYSHFLYQLGLVDTNTYNEMTDIEESGKIAIKEGRFVDAFVVCTTVPTLQLNISDSMSSVFLYSLHHSL